MFELELPERFRRYVPLAVWLIVAFVLLLIPFKIIGYGYLPDDDALRYAAKAVSGKTLAGFSSSADAFKIDHNLGWNGLLGVAPRRDRLECGRDGDLLRGCPFPPRQWRGAAVAQTPRGVACCAAHGDDRFRRAATFSGRPAVRAVHRGADGRPDRRSSPAPP